MQHHEYNLQKALCTYLGTQYPHVRFISTGTSLKLTQAQAGRNKSIQDSRFKAPDLFIIHPKVWYDEFHLPQYYHGLWLELKIECPYKKDGTIKKNEHLIEQEKSLNELKMKGYWAEFAWSFNMGVIMIDNYLKNGL